MKETFSSTIEGVEYFKCSPGYAMFVAIDKLFEIPEKVHKHSKGLKKSYSVDTVATKVTDIKTSRHVLLQSGGTVPLSVFEDATDQVRHNTMPASTLLQVKQDLLLSMKAKTISTTPLDGKVSFYDKHNRKLSGTLRWVGKNEVDGSKMLGVEAVSWNYACMLNLCTYVCLLHVCMRCMHAMYACMYVCMYVYCMYECVHVIYICVWYAWYHYIN